METQPLSPKGAQPPPQFSAHFYCGQMAECIKMPLGTQVVLSRGDFVLVGNPAPSPKRGQPPIFGPCLLRPNGCMDRDATWYEGRPRPRRHCVRWRPSSPPQKGGSAPHFRPNFTARRSYASAVLGVVILSVRPSVCPSVTCVLFD